MKIVGLLFKVLTILLELIVLAFLFFIKEAQQFDSLFELLPIGLVYLLSILLLIMIIINISTIFIKNFKRQKFIYFAVHWIILLIILFLIKLPIIIITGVLFIAIVPVYFADYDEKIYWKPSTD